MQATVNTNSRQFGFNRFTTAMMALGIAAGIAIGATGATVVDDLPSIQGGEQTVVLPQAYSSANQGEGLVAGAIAVSPAVRAYTSDRQGDGLVGGNATVSMPLVDHTSLGQGEGMLGGFGSAAVLSAPITAHFNAGMGEGWISNGQPATTTQAHASDGQGEGWIGNGRP